MNRNAGLSAGVIALIAVVVHLALPTGQESGTGGEQRAGTAGNRQTQPAEPAGNAEKSPTAEPEGPWLATRYFFGYAGPVEAPMHRKNPADRQPRPVDFSDTADVPGCAAATEKISGVTCGEDMRRFFGIRKFARVEFLLATVPDPLHTRLSLFTDSSIQAIQQAASQAGWVFATQWLPWNDTVDPKEKDPEKRQKQRGAIRNEEKQPGALVYRHSVDCAAESDCTFNARVLVIFLLGETPTAGVNTTQFQFARAYMRAIGEPEKIGILGPTFSGSFDSLHALIDDDGATGRTTVVSGTATDPRTGGAFRKEAGGRFHSASMRGSFRDVLTLMRIPTDDAAELVEDESGFGDSLAAENAKENETETEKIRLFRFPRDISHLRNAWRESTPQSKNGAPAPDLDFSLKDAETGEDSVPMFSQAQSPLSQNAVLDEITGAIRRDRVRMVRIDATNVLDLLFLARVLKQQCPDTRLLLSHPDLLFVEAAQNEALTGTLALSTYPTFTAASDWTGQHYRPAIFPDANAEGVFNAARLLLNDRDEKQAGDPDPGKTLDEPPTWLLTLDREGFLPVELWRKTPSASFDGVAPPPEQALRLPEPSSLWILVAGLTALAILGLAVWVRYLGREKSPLVGAAFDMTPLDQCHTDWHPDHLRLFYLFLFILALTAIEAVLSAPLWTHRATWSLRAPSLLAAAGAMAGIVLALICLWRFKGSGFRAAAACSAASFAAVVALWLVCCYGERGFFFSFRALELRVGTSPAWPVLAALAILLGFAFTHLWRLQMVVYEVPEAAMASVPTLLQPRLERSYSDLNRSLESPLGLFKDSHWMWGRYALGLAAIVFLVTRLDVRLSSIDGTAYNVLSIALTLAAAAALLVSACQVLIVWRALEGILGCLNTMPLGRSFVRTDQAGRNRPIWVRQLHVQSIDVHARSMLVLHDISLLLAKSAECSMQERWKEWVARYRERVKNLLAPETTRARARGIRQSIRDLSGEIAAEAFGIAFQHWTSESLVTKAGPAEAPVEEGGGGNAPLEIPGDPAKIGSLAETFVALHYSPYLLYCVRQIRNLILFLSLGFLFFVVCLNSYGHQSPQFIGRSLVLLFALIGTITVTCLVGLERDPILSRIAGTTPGKLDIESYLKVIGYGTLPVLGLLASQFPSISGFLYSWVAPTLQALH